MVVNINPSPLLRPSSAAAAGSSFNEFERREGEERKWFVVNHISGEVKSFGNMWNF